MNSIFNVFTLLYQFEILSFPLLPLSNQIYLHQILPCTFNLYFANFTLLGSSIYLNSNKYSMTLIQFINSIGLIIPLNDETSILGFFPILLNALIKGSFTTSVSSSLAKLVAIEDSSSLSSRYLLWVLKLIIYYWKDSRCLLNSLIQSPRACPPLLWGIFATPTTHNSWCKLPHIQWSVYTCRITKFDTDDVKGLSPFKNLQKYNFETKN